VTAVLVRTDDEVYRVDSVWLGPPRATFPWRARYVSYGLGLLVMVLVMFVQRRIGIGLDFFSVAWALILTILITRFLGQRINDERPLGQVVAMFWHEVSGPRARTAAEGGQLRTNRVRIGPVGRARGRTGRPQRTSARPPVVAAATTETPWPRAARPERNDRGAVRTDAGEQRPRRERARAAP
jgi:hypothetical protein